MPPNVVGKTPGVEDTAPPHVGSEAEAPEDPENETLIARVTEKADEVEVEEGFESASEAAKGGRTVCFVFVLFCFNSCICNPLHAARRAMAAALPLPSRGQRRDFQGIPISDLEPACAVIVRHPLSPSSLSTSKNKI